MPVQSLDIIILNGIGIIYDWVEDRYGNVVAWLLTLSIIAALFGAVAALLIILI